MQRILRGPAVGRERVGLTSDAPQGINEKKTGLPRRLTAPRNDKRTFPFVIASEAKQSSKKNNKNKEPKKERSKTMTKRAITGIIGTCCAIAVLAYAGTASATTMCVTSDNTNIILDPSIEGTGYTRDEATKTWTTTFPNYTVSGIATCNSTSGTYARAYPEYNFDNNHASSEGVYCWCRMKDYNNNY
jgi:hypothetical protein